MATEAITTKAVRMNGWTLPKGAEVSVRSITMAHDGQQQHTATCVGAMSEWQFAIPLSALPASVVEQVRWFRLDDATGCMVEVDA